ncbi:Gll3447 protein [Halorubrum sp. DM2]|uniref:FG-GAP repeat domain-containing protein n=1 Tax=Halorubrum sp. DM2 TaxID=2527867 RepID=UPI0024B86CD4|nr:VCBS repeat-containing protein [Halorubrum sp. DM2]VTT88142.1 Gll3447 protein [Halorubrum sp. DM2]
MQTQRHGFRHEVIDSAPPTTKLGICLTTDLTGNGRPDVIVGGAGPETKLFVAGGRTRLPSVEGIKQATGLAGPTLFWYENPGWERHAISDVPQLGVGCALGDVDGDGRVDVLAGQGIHYNGVFWFEQPSDPRGSWERHLVTDRFEKYHDLAFGDVDDDGEPEVVGLSQRSDTVFYYDVPADPTDGPWPAENCHVVDGDSDAEGVWIGDLDGDGRTELVVGTDLYRRREGTHEWDREPIAVDWDDVRVAVGDIDADGEYEVVLAEGDSPTYGTHPGRVGLFDRRDDGWEETVIADGLFCPHSLQLADFDGNGRLDVYAAEMSLGENRIPRHYVFRNEGDGQFERTVVAEGVETHEAKAVDLTGTGLPDVVGKSYTPDHHVDVWHNERDGER